MSDFEPELQKAAHGHLKATWYGKQIQPAGVNPSTAEFQSQVKTLGDFCRAFLRWWIDLHNNPGLGIDLVHTGAFGHLPFTQEAFPALIVGERYLLDSKRAVQHIAAVPFERKPNLTGLGHFISALSTVSA